MQLATERHRLMEMEFQPADSQVQPLADGMFRGMLQRCTVPLRARDWMSYTAITYPPTHWMSYTAITYPHTHWMHTDSANGEREVAVKVLLHLPETAVAVRPHIVLIEPARRPVRLIIPGALP
jgi:hypothetical protein